MAVGALFDDALGRFARTCAAPCLLALGFRRSVRYPLIVGTLPAGHATWYPTAIIAVTVGYGLFARDRRYLAAAAASVAAWLAYSGLQSYQQLRRVLAGLDQIVCGLLFLRSCRGDQLEESRHAGQLRRGFPSRPFRARR